jgi:hypothetical protein
LGKAEDGVDNDNSDDGAAERRHAFAGFQEVSEKGQSCRNPQENG